MTPPDIGVMVGAWNALVRRARIGREKKAVALAVSSYANADGTGIHCGVARLAVDCEIGYSTARRYLAWMRQVGLIELVRHGNQRKGLSDEYRLTIGPDILEHIQVPSPNEYDALRDELRNANRAGQKSRRIPNQRSPRESADEDQAEPSALAIVSADEADQRSPGESSALTQDEPPPSLYTSPEELTSPITVADVRTEAAGTRARGLQIIEGNPDAVTGPSNARTLSVVPDSPPPTKDGHGFCLACYAKGEFTVAADRENGSSCAYHLRSA